MLLRDSSIDLQLNLQNCHFNIPEILRMRQNEAIEIVTVQKKFVKYP